MQLQAKTKENADRKLCGAVMMKANIGILFLNHSELNATNKQKAYGRKSVDGLKMNCVRNLINEK